MLPKKSILQFAAALIFIAVCACSCTSAPAYDVPSPHQNGVRYTFDSDGLRAAVSKLPDQDFAQDGTIRVSVRGNNKNEGFWHKDIILPETADMTWGIDHIRHCYCPIAENANREFILIVYAYGWGCGAVLATDFKLAIVEILDDDVRLVFNKLIGWGRFGHSLYEEFGCLEYSMSFVDVKSRDGKVALTIFDRDGDEITGVRKYVLGTKEFVPVE